MTRLQQPLFLLVLIPFFLVWAYPLLLKIFKKKTNQDSSVPLPSITHKLLKSTPSLKLILSWIISFLYLVSIGILSFSLARPQGKVLPSPQKQTGIDIVLTLDTSTSMNAEDFSPNNRFHVAQENLKNFILKRTHDRIGLVVFSGEAMTLCPPTHDYGVLQKQLEFARTGILKDGTAIGDALMQSINRLRDSTAKSRIIVLLTDGDNNYGQIDPESAAEIAKGFGIKVYTIGIGTEGEVPIPFVQTNIFGQKIKTYIKTMARLDMNLLHRISETTGGKAYRATDPKALNQVLQTINTLEKSEIELKSKVNYEELYQTWLKYALLLILFTTMMAWAPLRRLTQ